MRKMRLHNKVRQLFLLLLSTLLLASPSLAALVTVDLKAEARQVVMPDGTSINMWGFFDLNDTGTNWVPAAISGLNVGDDLTISLTNNLAEDVSIVITGQNMNFMPVRIPDGQGRDRVHSLSTAVASGGNGSFSWTNLKAGTFLLQSGSHPAKQVQMGLYGSVVVAGYSDITYDNEALLLYSEIDPVLHAPAAAAKPLNYKPKYFLINGQPYATGQLPIAAGAAGQTLLIRLLNAGLKTHVPMLLNGPNMKLIAEDGNLYPYPKTEYSALMGPGKTIDALWMPTSDGVFPMIDRGNYLTSNGISNSGMLTHLAVGGMAADTVTILRTRYNGNLDQLRVWANSTASPGAVLTLAGHGDMPYLGNANFDYRFYAPGVLSNPGTASVSSDQGGSDVQNVAYTAAPVAVDDAHSVDEGAMLNIAAVGVLGNDSRGGYFTGSNALTASVITDPANGVLTLNSDGSFSYMHDGSETVSDSFTYVANAINTNTLAVLASSTPATVVLTINPVNDDPVANDDAGLTDDATAMTIDVLANDTDIDSANLSVASVDTTGTNGSIINNGSDVTYTPNLGFLGDDVFTYMATDGTGNSNSASVTVTVSASVNEAPVATDDSINITVGSGSVVINLIANDYDLDGTIDAATTCVRLGNYPNNCANVNPKNTRRRGTVVNNYDGTVLYNPPVGFVGTDSFNYRVKDDDGADSNKAKVRINITE
jgi:VCBS repeat-containing protein